MLLIEIDWLCDLRMEVSKVLDQRNSKLYRQDHAFFYRNLYHTDQAVSEDIRPRKYLSFFTYDTLCFSEDIC